MTRSCLAVPDERGDAGDDVGVDGARGGLEQGVDERALAALELPHDRHGERALLDHRPHVGEPPARSVRSRRPARAC